MEALPPATAAPVVPKATVLQLVFLTYAVICSGAYGLEQMVSASGPGLSLLVLLVLPLIYAAPISLTCAELSARFPVEGGYYGWVRMAFGDFVGYTSAWLVWLTLFATNAAFAVLFGNYLRYFVPDLSPAAHFAVAATVVWAAVFLNYRGIRLVGSASVVFTLLIFIPFFLMTVLGLLQWRFSPIEPFAHPDKPLGLALFDGFLIAMWLYGGYEKLTVNSHEVENPSRSFPIALAIAVPLCALSYFLPTLAALAANGDWQAWGESHYVPSAAAIGGTALGTAMAAGASSPTRASSWFRSWPNRACPCSWPGAASSRRRFRGPPRPRHAGGLPRPHRCRAHGALRLPLRAARRRLLPRPVPFLPADLRRLLPPARPPRVFFGQRFPHPPGSNWHRPHGGSQRLLVALVIRQGIWPAGVFDRNQALLDLAIFTSGPLSYFLFRALRRARAPRSGRALLLCPRVRAFRPRPKGQPVRVGMDTRSRPWAYVPGLDYSREDWTKAPQILPAQIRRLEGVDIDLMKALGKRLERPLEVVPHAWESIEEGLLAKRFDVILNAWVPSDRTPPGIIASSAYYEYGMLVAVRAEETGIRSYRDLAGRRVGHFQDRVVDRSVQGLAASTLVPVDDSDQLFDLLAAGKVDAVVEDSTYVRWRVARDRQFQVVGDRLNKMGYCLALRREDRALYEEVQAAIKELLASGEVEAIRQRWESPEPSARGPKVSRPACCSPRPRCPGRGPWLGLHRGPEADPHK